MTYLTDVAQSASKMDHSRVIYTSLVFNYDGIGKLRRLSLDHLCKSVLGYEMQKSPGKCVKKAEATMKLVLAILEHGADTYVPLPDEVKAGTYSQRASLWWL